MSGNGLAMMVGRLFPCRAAAYLNKALQLTAIPLRSIAAAELSRYGKKMNKIMIALAIGIVAGIIDIIPMIFKRLDKTANLSAFSHWIFLGLIIPFVSWNIEPWIKGLIISEISAVPILFLVATKDQKSILPIIVMSAILGIAVAIAGEAFIG